MTEQEQKVVDKALNTLFGKPPREVTVDFLTTLKQKLVSEFSINWLSCTKSEGFTDLKCLHCEKRHKSYCVYGELVHTLESLGILKDNGLDL